MCLLEKVPALTFISLRNTLDVHILVIAKSIFYSEDILCMCVLQYTIHYTLQYYRAINDDVVLRESNEFINFKYFISFSVVVFLR